MSSPKVERIEVRPVSLTIEGDFRISRAVLDEASAIQRVVVRVVTTDGAVGFGEGVVIPSVMGLTGAGLLEAIELLFGPLLAGHDLFDIRGMHAAMDAVLPGYAPAKAAVDIAVHDAAARTLGVSVGALLGGRRRDSILVTQSIGAGEPEEVAAKVVRYCGAGITVAKLKLHCSEKDVEMIRAAREAAGPEILIRIDANAGYRTRQSAEEMLRRLLPFDIFMIEQPLPAEDLHGMAELARVLPVPLLADESVGTLANALAVIQGRAGDVLNVKVQMAGGLHRAMQIVDLAEAASVPVLVGSRMESGIGAAANLQLIGAITDLPYPCDLKSTDTYQQTTIRQEFVAHAGRIGIPSSVGLGVEVSPDIADRFGAL